MRTFRCLDRDRGEAVRTSLCCRSSFLFWSRFLQHFNGAENDKCDNDEVNHIIDKKTIIYRWCTGFFAASKLPYVCPDKLMYRLLKSTLPSNSPIGGMITSVTSELTILPNAVPIITPNRKIDHISSCKKLFKFI
ncbi:hypothetical protein NBRC111894_1501 [Sporolactobacillus inulinus]|uniref:Uncharacterized protein n=1 Tax=Sporolactobacillus inulinus TaxID=2078 RepID=A0A4Y1ZA75_9BACL|nr:hypothetical protein NBRC111894_1501 [Sporolactobacillus inulinus]